MNNVYSIQYFDEAIKLSNKPKKNNPTSIKAVFPEDDFIEKFLSKIFIREIFFLLKCIVF